MSTPAPKYTPGTRVIVGGQPHEIVSWVERDKNWKVSGYRTLPLHTGMGDGFGYTKFTPATSITGVMPTEWTVIIAGGGTLEERWTYNPRTNIFTRELRRTGEPARLDLHVFQLQRPHTEEES